MGPLHGQVQDVVFWTQHEIYVLLELLPFEKLRYKR